MEDTHRHGQRQYPDAQKGRGAPDNHVSTRFALPFREMDGDWRDIAGLVDADPHPRTRKTYVTIEHPKSILSFNHSPDLPFEQSINPYRGCEHGCIYCYARPSHAFHDLSPGLDFETQLFAKPNAAQLLRATFSKPQYKPKVIALGTNTDPYQPIEKRYEITRNILQVCLEFRNPVTITTKSDRLLRDADILQDMARQNLIAAAISVTTLDSSLARKLEPRAATPQKRLSALRQLSNAGVPMHISVSPIIPAITDHEIERIIAAGAAAGVLSASFIPVRLPHEVAPLFRAWLDVHYPDRAVKVMAMIRDLRGGRDNDPRFGERMRGQGPYYDLILSRFKRAVRKAGINRHRWHLDCDQFERPGTTHQLDLGL